MRNCVAQYPMATTSADMPIVSKSRTMPDSKKTPWSIAVVSLSIIAGCTGKQAPVVKFWKPTDEELSRAGELARRYASEHLNVSEDHVARMKVRSTGWYEGERKVLSLRFYDPGHFPDWASIGPMYGGFPYYFQITVAVSSWCAVDHYAATQ